MISITFTFDTLAQAQAELPSVFSPTPAGLVTPATLVATPKAAAAPSPALGPATAKTGGAPGKTVAAPTLVAASVGAALPVSTAATVDTGKSAAGATAVETPAASSASSIKPVEYADLKNAIFALASKSRSAAMELVASFNVDNFKALPPEQWAAALEATKAKLAEVEVA